MEELRQKVFAVRPPSAPHPSAGAGGLNSRGPTPLFHRTAKERSLVLGTNASGTGTSSPSGGSPPSTERGRGNVRGRSARDPGSAPHSSSPVAPTRPSSSLGKGQGQRKPARPSSSAGGPVGDPPEVVFMPKDTIDVVNARKFLLSLNTPCPVDWPGCCWRTLAHYLLEDVQWLQQSSNNTKGGSTNHGMLSSEVEALKVKVKILEQENEAVKLDHAADKKQDQDRIGELIQETKELEAKVDHYEKENRQLENQIVMTKLEHESTQDKFLRAEVAWTEEKEQYVKLVQRLRKEFENAVRTVELLMDDKHRMLSMLDNKKLKKTRPKTDPQRKASTGGTRRAITITPGQKAHAMIVEIKK